MKISITIGNQTRTATLLSNSSTEALVAALQEAPIKYEAHDYGNLESGPLRTLYIKEGKKIIK